MNARAYITLGWWGYLICAAIYVYGGLKAGDYISTLGSLFFFTATVCFMVPHYKNVQKNGE